MVNFTYAAIQHIQSMLKTRPQTAAFRLSLKKTGCSGYMFIPEIVEQKKESDLEMPLMPFLVYLDAASAPLMEGTTVDYVKKNLSMSQLVFENPRAESVCGCGESFKVRSEK